MKRPFMFAAAVLVLAACSDSPPPTAPVAGPALAAGTASAGATNTKAPFSSVLMSPCSGETVVLTTTVHMVTRTETDADGGTHMKTHANFQNGSAVAIGSGRRYRVVSTENSSANSSAGGATETTDIVNFLVISQGATDNWVVHMQTHVTVNANGEPTAVVDHVSTECRG